MNGYLGLEMAMSLISYNSIADYLKTGIFTGNEDFKSTMSCDQFKHICANIIFRPNEDVALEVCHANPLWHSCHLLENVQTNCSMIEVPVGSCTHDKHCAPTKAQTKAKLFICSKPDFYDVCFYVD